MHVWIAAFLSLSLTHTHTHSLTLLFVLSGGANGIHECECGVVECMYANKISYVGMYEIGQAFTARHQRNKTELEYFSKKNYILWKHAYKSTLLNANCNPWFCALLKPTDDEVDNDIHHYHRHTITTIIIITTELALCVHLIFTNCLYLQ